MLYRIVSLEDWKQTLTQGQVPRCGADERDGFVHLSTQDNFIETANLYYEEVEQPVVLEIDPEVLGDALRWEVVPSRNNQAFPHLYAPGVPLSAVRSVATLRMEASGFARGETFYSRENGE